MTSSIVTRTCTLFPACWMRPISPYQGAMAAAYQFGYRVAVLVAGAGALYLAEAGSFGVAYQAMAGLMLLGVMTVILVAEPVVTAANNPNLILRSSGGFNTVTLTSGGLLFANQNTITDTTTYATIAQATTNGRISVV